MTTAPRGMTATAWTLGLIESRARAYLGQLQDDDHGRAERDALAEWIDSLCDTWEQRREDARCARRINFQARGTTGRDAHRPDHRTERLFLFVQEPWASKLGAALLPGSTEGILGSVLVRELVDRNGRPIDTKADLRSMRRQMEMGEQVDDVFAEGLAAELTEDLDAA